MAELKPPTFGNYNDDREARSAEILRRVQRQLHDTDELIAAMDRQKVAMQPRSSTDHRT